MAKQCLECSSLLDYSSEHQLYRCRNFLCNHVYTEVELYAAKDLLWYEKAFHDFPSIIAHEYVQLSTLINKGQIYGALLQLKDVLEVLIKFPSLIILSDMYQEGKKNQEPFITLLKEPISLGHWRNIAYHIKKSGHHVESVDAILHDVYQIYITNDIPNWRNEKIGHGALTFDSQSCLKNDIEPLLAVIKQHFEDNEEHYQNISFYKFENGVKYELSGKENGRNIAHSLSNLYIDVSDRKNISLFPYISLLNKGIYFFDSYDPRKKKTALLNYPDGKKSEFVKEVDEVINNHYKALARHLKHVSPSSSIGDKTYSELEINILSKLQEVEDFQSPDFLMDFLKNCFNEKKGFFMIQMEQGMGKTTFVRALDELSLRKKTLRDTSVRAYYFNDSFLYKTQYFAQKLTDLLRKNRHGELEISNLLPLTLNSEQRKVDFIRLLNEYHEAHRRHFKREKLLIILDGIDEIPHDDKEGSIFDYLPDRKLLEEQLNDGIFLLLTCRTNEEASPWIKRKLSELSFTKESLQVKTFDDEYIELLKQYILKSFFSIHDVKDWRKLKKEEKKQINEKVEQILEIAENRFVYLNIIKDIYHINKENTEQLLSEGVFVTFMQGIKHYYGEKYFNQFLSLLTIISTAKEPLTIEEISFLNSEDRLTFKLLAFLTDMRGFLKIERSTRGNLVSISNVIWKTEIEKFYSDVIRQTLDSYKMRVLSYPLEERTWENAEYDGLSYLLANAFELVSIDSLKLMAYIGNYFAARSKANYQLNRAQKMIHQVIDHLKDHTDEDSLLLRSQAYITYGELLYQQHAFDEALSVSIKAETWLKQKKKSLTFELYDKRLLGILGVKARSFWALGNYTKALNTFNKIEQLIKLHKGKQINDYDLLENISNRATLFIKLSRNKQAEIEFTNAINKWESLYNMGYHPAITLNGLANDLLNRGTVYQNLKLYGKAISDTKKAIQYSQKLEETCPDICLEILINGYFNLGGTYKLLENNKEAIAAYSASIQSMEKAIDVGKYIHLPHYVEALLKRGQQFKFTKQIDEATSDFSLAIELIHKHSLNEFDKLLEAHIERFNILKTTDAKQEAMHDANVIIDMFQQKDAHIQLSQAYFQRAILLNNMGRDHESLTDLGIALNKVLPYITKEKRNVTLYIKIVLQTSLYLKDREKQQTLLKQTIENLKDIPLMDHDKQYLQELNEIINR